MKEKSLCLKDQVPTSVQVAALYRKYRSADSGAGRDSAMQPRNYVLSLNPDLSVMQISFASFTLIWVPREAFLSHKHPHCCFQARFSKALKTTDPYSQKHIGSGIAHLPIKDVHCL